VVIDSVKKNKLKTSMPTRRAVFVTMGIFPGNPTRAATEVRARQNLLALRALGYETTVITMPDPHQRSVEGPVVWLEPKIVSPFIHFFLNFSCRRKIRRTIARQAVDNSTVILCEHWAAMLCCPTHPRVVYSFHDFESRLTVERRKRKGTPVSIKSRVYWWAAERLERWMIKQATRVLSVSASEAEKLRTEWGADAIYIPTVPEETPAAVESVNTGPLRLWIYGSSAATSNKIVLDHLANGLFDKLKAALPTAEFHQAGKFDTYDADKIEWLKRNFQVHGFIADLGKIFQTGDICLIPYEKDTGFRTKIPEACGYGMIPAGYTLSFACCPEMWDGENCVMAANPEDFDFGLPRSDRMHLLNFFGQYHLEKYLELKKYPNVVTQQAGLRPALASVLQAPQTMLAYNEEIRSVTPLKSLKAIVDGMEESLSRQSIPKPAANLHVPA